MIAPECRALYMVLEEFFTAYITQSSYVRYLGRMDVPSLAVHLQELVSGDFGAPADISSIGIDISSFCLSVKNNI